MKYNKIAINGIHHSVFNHRMPLGSVRFIAIDGDCSISSINTESDMARRTAPVPPVYQPCKFKCFDADKD